MCYHCFLVQLIRYVTRACTVEKHHKVYRACVFFCHSLIICIAYSVTQCVELCYCLCFFSVVLSDFIVIRMHNICMHVCTYLYIHVWAMYKRTWRFLTHEHFTREAKIIFRRNITMSDFLWTIRAINYLNPFTFGWFIQWFGQSNDRLFFGATPYSRVYSTSGVFSSLPPSQMIETASACVPKPTWAVEFKLPTTRCLWHRIQDLQNGGGGPQTFL